MERRHFAVLASTSIWFIYYLISLYFFSYKFSKSLIPIKLRNKTSIKILNRILLYLILVSPVIAGLFYRIEGLMEKGNGIA